MMRMMISLTVGVGDGGAIFGSTFGLGQAGRVDEGVGEGVGVTTGAELVVALGVGVGVVLGDGLALGVTEGELVACGLWVTAGVGVLDASFTQITM